MRLSLLTFLTLTIATSSQSKSDHWKHLLWENGIKVLSESENPYNLLSHVIQEMESEDETIKIEPVINELLTRILVMNSDKSRHTTSIPETSRPGKKGLSRFIGQKSDIDVKNSMADENLTKTGETFLDLFGNFHNKNTSVKIVPENFESIAGKFLNNNFTESADNVVNWLQKRFNELANSTSLNQEDTGRGGLKKVEKSEPGGFLNLRRGENFFGQMLEGFLKSGADNAK